jgi:hypothetical protein
MSDMPSSSAGSTLSGVAQWQLGHGVVEEHLHAQAFSQYRQLSTDRAVADDAQLFATDFEGVGCAFDPAATVAGSVFLRDAAQQQDGLGQHQLGHGTGVGVRCVEHAIPRSRSVQVDLVGADAETADSHQLLGVSKISSVSWVRERMPMKWASAIFSFSWASGRNW